MTEITDLATARETLGGILDRDDGQIVVLTGAGISTESGVPDFRSPGGVWSKMAPIEFQDFVVEEACRLEDWQRRFDMAEIFAKAAPNAAHCALAEFACEGRIDLVITQNVDGLHARAGTPADRLVELHGNSTYASCINCGARAALEDQRDKVARGESPRCDDCNGLLKAAVVSFGQAMPVEALEISNKAASQADVFIVIGSSLAVQPAAQLPVIAAQAGASLVIINREATSLDPLAKVLIRTPIAECFAHFLAEKTK